MNGSGRTALITGASSGIGAATFPSLAAAGFKVVGVARRLERVEEIARDAGGRALHLDVTDPESVAQVADALPDVSVLVNNAGGALGLEPVAKADEAHWQEMYEANVMGVMRMTKVLLPALERSGHGHIVLIGSVAGAEVYPGGGGYTAAKHGAHAIAMTLRLELLGKPIRVTEVAPGMVETEFSLVRFGGDEAKADAVYDGTTPLTGADVADVIAYAVTRPPHVDLDYVSIQPTDQATARDVHRRQADLLAGLRGLGRLGRLAEQGARRLPQAPPPGRHPLLLLLARLHHALDPAHRDLDPVASRNLLVALVVPRQGDGHRLEAVLGDLQPGRVVEDRCSEHQLVVELRLDQDDVHVGEALPPRLHGHVKPGMGEKAERLVADRGHPHVRDAPHTGTEDRRDAVFEVVYVGDERVDHDDELGASLHGDVDVGRGDDPPVDQLPAAEIVGLVDDRQGAGGSYGTGDRDVVPVPFAEDDPLARVEIRGHDPELGGELTEVIGPVGVGEHVPHVLLDAAVVVDAGRQPLGESHNDVDHGDLAGVAGEAANHRRGPQRERGQAAGEAPVVRPQQGSKRGILDR